MGGSPGRKPPSESGTAILFCNYCNGEGGGGRNSESLETLQQIKNYLLFKTALDVISVFRGIVTHLLRCAFQHQLHLYR